MRSQLREGHSSFVSRRDRIILCQLCYTREPYAASQIQSHDLQEEVMWSWGMWGYYMDSDVSVFEHLGNRCHWQINFLESFIKLTKNMHTYWNRKHLFIISRFVINKSQWLTNSEKTSVWSNNQPLQPYIIFWGHLSIRRMLIFERIRKPLTRIWQWSL